MILNADQLFHQIVLHGVPFENHFSDLYIPVNETTKALIAAYKFRQNVTTFKRVGCPLTTEGMGLWYDVPFAYAPYWAKVFS